jgi:hypothetical protein
MTAVVERLVGRQTPRVSTVPAAELSLGDRAVRFAAEVGMELDPWQQLVLRDSMGVTSAGMWAASTVGLLCPRQNGKGAILEALELFHMFVLQTPLVVHSAHKFDTSQEHFVRLRTTIEANPDMQKHVKAMPTSQGHEAIVLRNGNRLKFKARTVGGAGRGFSGDLVVLDEAMILPELAVDAMLPTLRARPNPQVWFTSSAGTAESSALWRVVQQGREGAPRTAYFEWGCESGTDPLDREAWAEANPGLGYRLSVEGLEDDLRLLSPDGFAREHLGIWDDVAAGIFPPGSWEALADPDAERGNAPAFAVATAPDRSWSAIGVAWKRPDGRSQVMLADYRPSTAWVAERVAELRQRWGGVVLVDMASRGLLADAVEPSQAEQAKAHNGLSDAVLAGTVRHGNEAALNTAVRGARWKPQSDTRVLDRKGNVDISPLVAAALAMHGLSMERPSVYEDRELIQL